MGPITGAADAPGDAQHALVNPVAWVGCTPTDLLRQPLPGDYDREEGPYWGPMGVLHTDPHAVLGCGDCWRSTRRRALTLSHHATWCPYNHTASSAGERLASTLPWLSASCSLLQLDVSTDAGRRVMGVVMRAHDVAVTGPLGAAYSTAQVADTLKVHARFGLVLPKGCDSFWVERGGGRPLIKRPSPTHGGTHFLSDLVRGWRVLLPHHWDWVLADEDPGAVEIESPPSRRLLLLEAQDDTDAGSGPGSKRAREAVGTATARYMTPQGNFTLATRVMGPAAVAGSLCALPLASEEVTIRAESDAGNSSKQTKSVYDVRPLIRAAPYTQHDLDCLLSAWPSTVDRLEDRYRNACSPAQPWPIGVGNTAMTAVTMVEAARAQERRLRGVGAVNYGGIVFAMDEWWTSMWREAVYGPQPALTAWMQMDRDHSFGQSCQLLFNNARRDLDAVSRSLSGPSTSDEKSRSETDSPGGKGKRGADRPRASGAGGRGTIAQAPRLNGACASFLAREGKCGKEPPREGLQECGYRHCCPCGGNHLLGDCTAVNDDARALLVNTASKMGKRPNKAGK